ncbi:uncharacterized protein LOC122682180 isoform X3 [Cervus elaphus]|uniref:uncharacterized protein LOC122682180 isoform X3 n=1 Tax=Cervus elaphus TaxID=9860 RepID=UPI001CC2D208|nr:uncharacterized protein LOC122682180 isoform X3 [Cervus elaphus]
MVLNPEPNTLKELPSPTLSSSPQPRFCSLTLWNCSPLCHRTREEMKSNGSPTVKGESPQHFRSRVPDGATSSPRSGKATERRNPTSKERQLRRHRRAETSYSTFKVRRGSHEEILLVQAKT